MIFLENVCTEFAVPVEGYEDNYFRLSLSAMIGEHINGNAFLDIPTRYPYSLSIERRVRKSLLVPSNHDDEYTYLPVVSGIVYVSLDEIKEFKKESVARKFCIENGIIESDEQTEFEDDSDGKEEDKHDIHKEIPQS